MGDLQAESLGSNAHRLNLRVLRFRTEPQRDDPALLARALLDSRRLAEALELTTTGLARDPSDLDLRLVHGLVLAERGRMEEAQLAFTQAAKAAPDWAEPWRQLADVLLRRDRPEQALVVAEHALAIEPGDEALESLRRAASLIVRARRFLASPDGEEPALLAQELIAAGRFADALEITRSALVLELDDADLLVAHARAARALGDLEEAASALSTASFEAPDWPEVWRLLAEVELERGEIDDARPALEAALRLDPTDVELRVLSERIARETAHHAERSLASVIVDLDD